VKAYCLVADEVGQADKECWLVTRTCLEHNGRVLHRRIDCLICVEKHSILMSRIKCEELTRVAENDQLMSLGKQCKQPGTAAQLSHSAAMSV
jgi:hypothetical protein